MTTKFNKDVYTKMRSKKDEQLSNLEKRIVCVSGKSPSATSSALVNPFVPSNEMTRMASPATLVEKIPTPISKRPYLIDWEKSNSHPSSVWDNAKLAVERAHEVVTTEDLKIF